MPPREAAACVGRAITAVNSAQSTQWREAERPGDYEARCFLRYGLVVLVDIKPSAGGSAATIFTTQYVDAHLRTSVLNDNNNRC